MNVGVDMAALRAQQRTEWDACAQGWRDYRAAFAEPSRPVTDRMLELAGVRAGDRVLDLACGNGNPTFELAELVGPAGRVVGLDLSDGMLSAASDWAATHAITNVEFEAIASEGELSVDPGSFDVATCRAGLQYMPDRHAAAAAVFDALRPGGRFVVMVLGSPDRCMPFTLTNGIVSRHVKLPELGTDRPGPVGLSTVDELAETLVKAGFGQVRTESLTFDVFEAPDPASAWRLFTETAGPFFALFASLTREQRQAMDQDAARTFAVAFPDGPVRPTGEALLAVAVKPAA